MFRDVRIYSFYFCVLFSCFVLSHGHIWRPLFIISLIFLFFKNNSTHLFLQFNVSSFQSQIYVSNGFSKYRVHWSLPLCLPIWGHSRFWFAFQMKFHLSFTYFYKKDDFSKISLNVYFYMKFLYCWF